MRQVHLISIADIGLDRSILCAPLRDVVGPRLAFLTSVSSGHINFKLADYLTAVAALSDAEFSVQYDLKAAGLTYDSKFIAAWQHAHVDT